MENIHQKKSNTIFFQLAFGILTVQNVWLLVDALVFQNLSLYPFYLDLLGFFLLDLSFIVFASSTNHSRNQLYLGALFISGWLLFRIWWQFGIFGGQNIFDTENFDPSKVNVSFFDFIRLVIYLIPLSGISLGLGTFFIWRAINSRAILLFFIYGIINAIASIFFILGGLIFIGLIAKIYLIPLIGIFVFGVNLFKCSEYIQNLRRN